MPSSGDMAVRLLAHGVRPSAQRLVVARYVLNTDEHPSAEQVWAKTKLDLPVLSRATVYNTLNLFVQKGLLRALVLADKNVVFDPNLERHHHFIDEKSGRVYDIPWAAVPVSEDVTLAGFEVHEYQVVLRGRKLPSRTRRKAGGRGGVADVA